MICTGVVKGFRLDNSFVFHGGHFFLCEEKDACLLVQREMGTTILLEQRLFQALQNERPSEELQFKLVQRGFADYGESRRPMDANDAICPDFFLIDMTNGCNLGCRYCFRSPSDSVEMISDEMLMDICCYIADYCRERGKDYISVQPWGGEPLLAFDKICRMDDFFKESGLHIMITVETNGTLIDEKIAGEIAKREIAVGVSVDGDAVIQDCHRPYRDGKGSFAEVKRAVGLLRKAGCRGVGSISVITKESVYEIERHMDFLYKDLDLSGTKLNLVRATAWGERELSLEEDEIDLFAERMLAAAVKLVEEGTDVCDSNLQVKISNLLHRSDGNICLSRGCMGGRQLISFDRKGGIYPCEMTDFPEERIGSIYDEVPLEEMIRKAMDGHAYYQEKKISECEVCPWWYYCRGGCSSVVKYNSQGKCPVDHNECRLNRALYPRLVDLIMEKPDIAEKLAGGA